MTTWDVVCGISEHSAYLKAAVERADPAIEILPIPDLHPSAVDHVPGLDLIWLNYQAALHSQWTPEAIRAQQRSGIPVGVTYHDTGVPNSDQCKGVSEAASAIIVHEPAEDLSCPGPIHYWRMGVPDWSGPLLYDQSPGSWCGRRPILGTVGFPFPWKNYDELCRITAELGWALLLIAPTHTAADRMRWEAINPHLAVEGFVERRMVGAMLAGCDATAFLYTCANTGQSGAVLQGIAARKPVFAFESCRQFRALSADPLANKYIRWCTTFQEVEQQLANVVLGRVDCGMVALAEQESWTKLGAKYAALWRSLVQ